MSLRIDRCTSADLERLLSAVPNAHAAQHHRERFALQADGSGVYLLAWLGSQNVGRLTLYTESKYGPVRRIFPRAAEINALEAVPQGRGTGTALVVAAETIASRGGHDTIGLGVELANARARRLYQRLGYADWRYGQVIDRWTERTDHGDDILHRDRCAYLIKTLGDGPGTADR